MKAGWPWKLGGVALVLSLGMPVNGHCQPEGDEPWLADRGTGIRTSIFGTYVRSRELLVSPFFEYYYDNDYEYKPAELGHSLEQDFTGKFRASEGLIFLGYGLNDRLALEFEAAVISATLALSAAKLDSAASAIHHRTGRASSRSLLTRRS